MAIGCQIGPQSGLIVSDGETDFGAAIAGSSSGDRNLFTDCSR